jgi:hypothetical protein
MYPIFMDAPAENWGKGEMVERGKGENIPIRAF